MNPADCEVLLVLYRSTGGSNWNNQSNWAGGAHDTQWYGVEVNDQGRVVKLSLGHNNLRGSIPPELGKLAALKELVLCKNNLSGHIPPQLGKLSALEALDLRFNELGGPIPPELGDLSDLCSLNLSLNQLRGPIPEALGYLNQLQKLVLFGNQLTGPIPKMLGELIQLERLDLSDNQLAGPIPSELGDLDVLEWLYVSGNHLNGEFRCTEIPPEVLKLCRRNLKQPSWDANPWSRPPPTVLESGFESALGWWQDVMQFGEGKSNKLKMVLVGLAEAGKTTVVRHFTERPIPKQSDRTVGIEITSNWRPSDDDPLQISIWDFAGQADYYSSHQLFLTKGALFLLVVDLQAFSEEVKCGVDNFTDPSGRIYWWLEMLHMRVPGAAVALVGSHVDQLESLDADLAGSHLQTVVSKFIQDKAENAAKSKSNCSVATPSTSTMRKPRQMRPAARKAPPKPIVLHEHVFKVSRHPLSVGALRQWIVEAAYGRDCPRGFHFPAVDQTVPKAWIEAYDAMDALRETKPCVLWGEAIENFSDKMSGSLPDAGAAAKVLLRAMQHREAEGGVLLSLADASTPVATDMLHLDPSWLIELVRRLADHNIVDKQKRGTLEQGLRMYAKRQGLEVWPLIDMHSVYCKSGRLNRDYLRFLWMYRKIEAVGTAVILTDLEFESIVSTMARLLVMYTARGADNLVVPARLPQYGDQRLLAPDTISDMVMTIECSFGQVYPPPGIVGRFLAWSAQQIAHYEECWQHGAFFDFTYQNARYGVFLYESQVEEVHDDGTVSMFAGLTLGIHRGPPPQAAEVLAELRGSLQKLVSDSAYGYPGLAGLIYFRPAEKIESPLLVGLRSVLDNMESVGNVQDRLQGAVSRLEATAQRVEVAAGSLEETGRKLGGIVNQLLEQDLLAAGDGQREYPRLVLVRPEMEAGEDAPHERIQHAGWDRWTKALSDVGFHKFRLHFLCEHDLSEVPCGPDGRGFPIEQLKDWAKQCLPLIQVSLWLLRVAVGTVSNVDLPLNEVLGAFVMAAGAELMDGIGKVPDRINRASLPVFSEGATEADIQQCITLQGAAYEALCSFMRQAESHTSRCMFSCLPGHRRTAFVDWRDNMVQVKNRMGGRAWVLKTNEDSFCRDQGVASSMARAPVS